MKKTKPYSEWMKVDLHIHTDSSRLTKENDYQGEFSIGTLKSRLIDNGVSIFSLTDHNIINIEAYRDYYNSYNPKEDPLLLLGVEFDIITSNNPHTYHSLIVFNISDINNAERIHRIIEEKYEDKNIDLKKRELSISEIVEIFPNEDFFFIPHAGNTKSILTSYKGQIDNAQKMVLLMQSALEKVPEKNIQRYNEGFDSKLVEAFRNKEQNAYLRFSDNHNASQYPCTGKKGEDHEFYRIKGSKSFETLRLAFIDPKSRIISSESFKNLNNQKTFIEQLQIRKDDTFSGTTLSFSPHLNVIIGGRSSGKSLLMTMLGSKIDGVQNLRNIYKLDFNNVKIKSDLDASNQVVTSISHDNIIYINQNEIVSLFEKKNLEELAKASGKKEKYNLKKAVFTEYGDELKQKIDDLVQNYSTFGNQELDKRFILHSNTIQNILKEEFIFKSTYENAFDWSSSIKRSYENISNLNNEIELFKGDEFLEFSEDQKQTIESFLKLVNTKQKLVINKDLITKRRNSFIQAANEVINRRNRSLTNESSEKAESIKKLRKLKKDVKNRFDKLLKLRRASNSLESFDYTLQKRLSIAQNAELILEVEHIGSIKDCVLDGIKHSSNDQNIFFNLLGLLRGDKSIKNLENNSAHNLRKKLKRQLDEIIKSYETPKDYLKYSDGTTSKKNSPGFNSEKYLDIILKNPNSNIVFIDQPEDNLGNRFIAETLVELLRKIKFEKQVFLVTHNPSVVVYGDAENIIIANNDGSSIWYDQFVLEDDNAQKEICKILDGGQFIFDMRARKYNIKRLLNDKKNEEKNKD